jgi:hypothetical protein
MGHENDAGQRRTVALPIVAALAGLGALGFGVAGDYTWAVGFAGVGLVLIAGQVFVAAAHRGSRAGREGLPNRRVGVGPLDAAPPRAQLPMRQLSRPLPDSAPTRHAQPVGLDGLVQQAVDEIRSIAEARDHRLQVDIELHGERVAGNARQLRQVLAVLLADAVRSTAPGGTITVRARSDGDAAVVSIGNSGVGLGRDLSRIREIAAQHGGRLDVRLAEDGAERIVTLPVLARAA